MPPWLMEPRGHSCFRTVGARSSFEPLRGEVRTGGSSYESQPARAGGRHFRANPQGPLNATNQPQHLPPVSSRHPWGYPGLLYRSGAPRPYPDRHGRPEYVLRGLLRQLVGADHLEVLVDEDVVWPVDADVVDLVFAVAQLHDAVDNSPGVGRQRSLRRLVGCRSTDDRP